MATVVLAGGGTAGHIEPALAVAREWLKNNSSDTCIFLGTKTGLENTLVPAAGFELRLIPKVKITRAPSFSWLRIPFDLISSVLASMKVLRNAEVLIGFGGYVSAPAYLAAALSRTPIVIHEANAKPGWANRLGAVFTSHLAIAHPVEQGKFSNALLAGLPLRSDSQGGYKPVAYVDAMADAYLAADLIIARSGAVTCSEFRALGRYALFVPLPIGNGEQFVNAASLVADGRAEIITQKEFTSNFIEAQIDRLLKAAVHAPISGDDQDLDAAQKIVALTEFALKS